MNPGRDKAVEQAGCQGGPMLRGTCALVTGSVSGLGHALAEGLAKSGANIIVSGLCESEEGNRVAEKLARDYKVETLFDPADLMHPDQIERMVSSAVERFGGIDILVNNAVVRFFSPIEDFRIQDWNAAISVNLTAPFLLARQILPHMKKKGWGRVINISSYYGWRGVENRIDYVTTKTALIGMTRAIAIETARTGVTCNAICPGTVLTPAIRGRIEGMARQKGLPVEDVIQKYAEDRSPVGRFVPEADVASAVVYLCGPASTNITGTVFPVDGGWLAS